MSIAPEPSTSRGEITLQPSYFSSSLYVDSFREDISTLVASFAEQYNESVRPFELFKRLWTEQGWCWLHLRISDGRARQAFLNITERLFIELLASSEPAITRAVALFALYTFHNTQPSSSTLPIHANSHIAIPTNIYQDLLLLPSSLKEPDHQALAPYATHILSTMMDAQVFHVLPDSTLNAQNPSVLPREVFAMDDQVASATDVTREAGSSAPKKKGRPSKRDKIRKAKEALASLERYVDKNYVGIPDEALPFNIAAESDATRVGHALFGQAPVGPLENYFARKNELLAAVYSDAPDGPQADALRRSNEAVLARLKQIDEMAAEKGLEVGGEGGEKTGLARVEKAVEELRQASGMGASGGILRLLDGAGMDVATPY
ncbi:hypothetical protein GY45DRAFT_1326196 [Cubamyces sp. BRFM 1775]|nr:hypothetical protein GY45DRAFT_1326196 [Cubamyces sp. BRFM 1775]